MSIQIHVQKIHKHNKLFSCFRLKSMHAHLSILYAIPEQQVYKV